MKEGRLGVGFVLAAVVFLLGLGQVVSLAQTDGDVYSFGSGYSGVHGLGDIGDCYVPTKIPTLSGVKAVAAGGIHSLVLLENGDVYSFGYNWEGQLGLGDRGERRVPTKIPTLSGVKAVAAGGIHSLVLLENGDVYSFGYNEYGELGLGDNSFGSTIPTKIPTLSGVKAIAAGGYHSLVLLENGDVYSFGLNTKSQLGLEGSFACTIPTKIPTMSGVKAIATGRHHSLVLLENGDVYSFGSNGSGELGLGETAYGCLPTKIPTLSGVKAIAAGGEHSLVLLENGDVYSCGSNSDGELGLGDWDERETLMKIPTLSNVKAIAAGGSHSLVLVGEPSAPTAWFIYSPTNPTTQDAIQFTGTATDPDGDAIASWHWDFDDGATSILQNPSHQYAGDGTYTVTLHVTDATGAVGETSQQITIGRALSATIERPTFLGPEPLHYEFMEGGELVLTYFLLDAEGNPLPDVQVELNNKCIRTNDEGIFQISVDEDILTSFGTPVGPTGYTLQPVTSVTGYSIESLPDLFINVLTREWEERWSGGSKASVSLVGLKAARGEGCVIAWSHDGELSFAREFEEASGLASSVGASVSLTSKLQRGLSLSAEVLLAHAQEDKYIFDDPTNLEQMLAFSGMMLWSVLELGQDASSLTPPGLIINPVMGFVTDALLELELPWETYRTEFTSVAGIKSKAEAVADLQGFVTQTFELLDVPQTVIPWQFLDTGVGASAELTAEIMVGQTMFPRTDERAFFLSCESKLDGYVDLPLGLLFPIDALLGGRVAVVLREGAAVALVYESLTRDGDDVVLDRYSVHLGQDLNANGIDDLVEVIAAHGIMFTQTVLNDLLSGGGTTSQILFPGGIIKALWELERAAREVGIALAYETICYRDLGDIKLDPSVIIGLLAENGLGIELTLQKETVWLKERGVWYDGDKYATEAYTFDAPLLGDGRALYDIWLDASGPLRNAIWSGIEAGTEYVVEDVVPEIPWVICVSATLIGGPVAGGACVSGSVGTIIATDIVELLGWMPSGVESRRGELVMLPERRAPGEPAYWEGVLAVGGFFSLFPQGMAFTPSALLTLTYTDDAVPPGYSESEFDIFGWDAELGRWLPLEAVVDVGTNTLTTQISTLTTYVVGIDVAPGRPWSLEASVGDSAVTLTWAVDDAADLEGFHVYRGATDTGPFQRLTDTPIESATYLDYPVEPGDWYYMVTAIDTSGNESARSESASAQVGSTCSEVQTDLAQQGWHMITLPGELCGTCTVGGSGNLVCALSDDLDPCYIFYYAPGVGGYVMAPPAENIPYHAGMGFWTRTYEDNVTVDAEVQVPDEAVEVALGNGWNQIGNPFPFVVSTVDLKVRCGDTELSLLDAQGQGWVSAYLFGYDTTSGGYVMLDPTTGCLQPWNGYWMRSYQDGCVLIIPPTECSSSAPAGQPLSVKELQARGLELPPAPPNDLMNLDVKEVLAGLTVRNVPNPIRSEHTTTFKVEGKEAELIQAIRVDIYNQAGQKVFTQDINAKELEWHTDNDTGEVLANGVYLYQIWVKIADTWYPTGVRKLAVYR